MIDSFPVVVDILDIDLVEVGIPVEEDTVPVVDILVVVDIDLEVDNLVVVISVVDILDIDLVEDNLDIVPVVDILVSVVAVVVVDSEQPA